MNRQPMKWRYVMSLTLKMAIVRIRITKPLIYGFKITDVPALTVFLLLGNLTTPIRLEPQRIKLTQNTLLKRL